MRAHGMQFLDIPDNYYDDLLAKYDLDPAMVDELRRNAILYDRDGDAEFFQIFTHQIADVFFFEILQRRRYGGYGAVNAPIRLAAQAREARPPGLPRI
jgi:3-dehydroshikimate dehydratase